MSIIVNHITKSYHGQKVLNNIYFEIKKNSCTCIMGPSGEGKTTLLRILMGLEKPDDGSVEGIKGEKLSVVFQEDRLCEELDAVTNVTMVLGKDKSTNPIIEEFDKVGLCNYFDKPVSKLSGGMKRRVAILRSCLMDADIYIMDEPFKGLDDELKRNVISYVKNKLKGKTLIVVTHDISEVDLLEAELIYLNRNKEMNQS